MRDIALAPRLGAPTRRRAPLVLIVDNDEAIRTTMSRLLRAEGYRAMPATQGVDANWVVERHGGEIVLVITDLLPPAPDGYHLGIPYERLRPYTPVLFTARASREENIRRGLLHPRAPYLRKPFAPSIFVRSVRGVIAAWPALPAA
ncbi:MAG: response regulator [Gemmatimonadota bacterium]|nr:response regulator [Gemmatimonadota bacterium]